MQHFIPLGTPPPVDGRLHFIFGKVASIDFLLNVGKAISAADYDFIIDANVMCNPSLPSLGHCPDTMFKLQPIPENVAFNPTPLFIIISGAICLMLMYVSHLDIPHQACVKQSDQEFIMDI